MQKSRFPDRGPAFCVWSERMGHRLVRQPFCDMDSTDVQRLEPFSWTDPDGKRWRVELGPVCWAALDEFLKPLREAGKPADTDEPAALDMAEPEGNAEPPAEPAADPAVAYSSSECGAEEKEACRAWWGKKWRRENLPEPPAVKRKIPLVVWEAWLAHKAELAERESVLA